MFQPCRERVRVWHKRKVQDEVRRWFHRMWVVFFLCFFFYKFCNVTDHMRSTRDGNVFTGIYSWVGAWVNTQQFEGGQQSWGVNSLVGSTVSTVDPSPQDHELLTMNHLTQLPWTISNPSPHPRPWATWPTPPGSWVTWHPLPQEKASLEWIGMGCMPRNVNARSFLLWSCVHT